MANLSVDGAVSGFRTTDVIRQLMQIERQPQLRLQNRRDAAGALVGVYQKLNAAMAAVADAASSLATNAGWQVMKATPSDPSAVTATAASGAAAGTLSFTVQSLAAAHALVTAGAAPDTSVTQVATPGSTITVNNVVITIGGKGTLGDVVNAVNTASGAGVAASAVQVGPNQYKLQLTAKATGAASAFTANGAALTGLGGSFGLVTQGTDAVIHVGGGAAPGYNVNSSSNTFSGVLPGVTFTVLKTAATPVTLAVQTDTDALAGKVKTLVDAANSALAFIRSQSGYDTRTRQAGPLLSDGMVGALQRRIVEAVSNAVPGNPLGGGAGAGIALTRDGSFTFDKAVFATAYANNPTGVRALFENGAAPTPGNGIAERLSQVARSATDFSTGSITLAIQAQRATISWLDARVADWDARLAMRESGLRRQYTAMEVALGRFRGQGNWLAQQLAASGAASAR